MKAIIYLTNGGTVQFDYDNDVSKLYEMFNSNNEIILGTVEHSIWINKANITHIEVFKVEEEVEEEEQNDEQQKD